MLLSLLLTLMYTSHCIAFHVHIFFLTWISWRAHLFATIWQGCRFAEHWTIIIDIFSTNMRTSTQKWFHFYFTNFIWNDLPRKFTRNETNCITRLAASLRFWSCWNVSLVKWTVIWYFFSWNTSHSAITCVKHFDSRYFYQNQTQMQGHRGRKIQNKCKALINTSHYMQCDN